MDGVGDGGYGWGAEDIDGVADKNGARGRGYG